MSQGNLPPIRTPGPPLASPGQAPFGEPVSAQVVPDPSHSAFNPYVAPVDAELSGKPVYRPPDQVSMPLTVVIALVCVSIVAAINGLNFFGQLRMGRVEWFAPSALTVSVLVLLGMISRHRLAFQWGRVLGVLGAILTTFLALIGGFTAYSLLVRGMNARQFQVPPGIDPDQFGMIMMIGAIVLAVMAVLQWTLFAALGFYSAREYFGLICPRCSADEASANDFVFTQAKCGRCQNVW